MKFPTLLSGAVSDRAAMFDRTVFPLENHHVCSVLSKANGEDPIGTAGTADRWLLVEIPNPWSARIWQEHPLLRSVFDLIKQSSQSSLKLRVMAIAPDPEYSFPDRVRIIDYTRPGACFAQFAKEEYLLPEGEVLPFMQALLNQPDALDAFSPYRQPTQEIRDLLVCTHTQVDIACGQFGLPLYQQLRQQDAASQNNLRVWQTTHFGGHKFAPTLIDFPSGQFWGHLEVSVLDRLVNRQGEVSQLRPFYRGWAGFGQLEQVAEREIWMQEGWKWLTYCKAGRVVRQDQGGWLRQWLKAGLNRLSKTQSKISPISQILLKKLNQAATWAEVEIDFISPDGGDGGTYHARVEVSGTVMSLASSVPSNEVGKLRAVNQYRVTRLVKRRE